MDKDEAEGRGADEEEKKEEGERGEGLKRRVSKKELPLGVICSKTFLRVLLNDKKPELS
jgi:hypothetical protein